jgi:hypothetical protein
VQEQDWFGFNLGAIKKHKIRPQILDTYYKPISEPKLGF